MRVTILTIEHGKLVERPARWLNDRSTIMQEAWLEFLHWIERHDDCNRTNQDVN